MNLKSVEYFLVLERERNFTRAAEKLFISQQTLSSNIAALEKELGVSLFIRTTPLKLSYSGQSFLEYAHMFRQLNNRMHQELNDINGEQKGEFRVYASFSHGFTVMPGVIEAFQKKYPNVTVSIIDNLLSPERELLQGDIDLCIMSMGNRSFTDGIEYAPFYDEEISLIANYDLLEQHHIALSDAAESISRGDLSPVLECPFIMGHPGDLSTDASSSLFLQHKVRPLIVARAHNISTQLAMCYRSMGLCFSPVNLAYTFLTPQQRSQMRVFRLPDSFRYTMYFAYKKSKKPWTLIAEMMDTAKQVHSDIYRSVMIWQRMW